MRAEMLASPRHKRRKALYASSSPAGGAALPGLRVSMRPQAC